MLISQQMFPHSLPDNILKQNHSTSIFDNKTYDFTGLKVISLNCPSMRSTARRARLRAPVYEHSPISLLDVSHKLIIHIVLQKYFLQVTVYLEKTVVRVLVVSLYV